jgi:Tannase and feruloyl esterase
MGPMTTRRSPVRGKVCSALTALTMALIGLGLAPSGAAAGPSSVIRPVLSCAELVRDFGIPGAATHVTSATEPEPVGAEPEHCDVRGYVEPTVGFQLRLPTSTYTGRYLQYGCDGLCGVSPPTPFPACGGPRGGDLAVAATDDGHVGQGGFFAIYDGTWAATNQAARNDYFYRAPHVVSRAAKRIIATYYGQPPERSYFNGCSTGGREGLLLAQRYPDDFDGIIAGAPGNAMGPLMGAYFTWLARTNSDADGAPILTGAKLPTLHQAVVAACDGLDGLVDGQLDDPRACRFDPGTIGCPPGIDLPSCLTSAQVAAARRLYAGPTDVDGRRLYPGGEPPGSELAWEGSIIPEPQFGASVAPLPDNYLRYVGYPIGAPHSSVAEFRFTVAEFDRLTPEGVKGNALSLDLSGFRRSGGKLLIWHGWADQSIPPAGTLDYYQRLWQHSGGLRRTQRWARVFMVPTVYHCAAFAGGYRLNEFDPFPQLVAWVERGKAPDWIIANQRDPQDKTVVRSRPVFPYPLRAAYDGTGSIDDASNFVPAQPSVPPHDTIDWVGTDLYTRRGPVAR